MIPSPAKVRPAEPSEVPVVWFVPGPCEAQGERQRFVSSVRAVLAESDWLGARGEVEEALDRILSVPNLRPGLLVAARGGPQPLLWVAPTEVKGPLIELSLPMRVSET